jgi:thioredoxin domain-containing protein 5
LGTDLCDANGITGYPQIHLYRDGEFVEKYKGNRDLNLLVDYIAKYSKVPEPEPPTVSLNLNPTGTVTVLDGTNFQSTVDNGPAFIKFYAPWCGHCKKLAPIWKQLAKHMQSKVSIAEVNCDENAALCKSQGVGGYPTLIYYPYGGAKSEYTMGRKLDQLKAFVDKASASYVS